MSPCWFGAGWGEGLMRALVVAAGLFTLAVLATDGHALGQRADSEGRRAIAATPGASGNAALAARCPGARQAVVFYRDATWRWQDARGATRTRYGQSHRAIGCAYVRWAAELWVDRAALERKRTEEWRRLYAVPEWPWYALALCEARNPKTGLPQWNYNGRSGFDGGLQFHPDTWNRHKVHVPTARGYAYAWQAPPVVQVAVARVTLAAEGWNAWPACSRKLGLR